MGVQPEMSYQNHPIKKEPVAVGSPVDVRKRNSEDLSSKPAGGPDLVPHPRKKPKLEKFVVSDLMKSPRKKSTEQEQEWKEKKKAKRKSSEGGGGGGVQETKRTWKVVSSFDWDNESTSSDKTHQKKLDVVLTQSHIKKGIKSEEERRIPIKSERVGGSKAHKHK